MMAVACSAVAHAYDTDQAIQTIDKRTRKLVADFESLKGWEMTKLERIQAGFLELDTTVRETVRALLSDEGTPTQAARRSRGTFDWIEWPRDSGHLSWPRLPSGGRLPPVIVYYRAMPLRDGSVLYVLSNRFRHSAPRMAVMPHLYVIRSGEATRMEGFFFSGATSGFTHPYRFLGFRRRDGDTPDFYALVGPNGMGLYCEVAHFRFTEATGKWEMSILHSYSGTQRFQYDEQNCVFMFPGEGHPHRGEIIEERAEKIHLLTPEGMQRLLEARAEKEAAKRANWKPKPCPTHVVQQGETLADISLKHYGSMQYWWILLCYNLRTLTTAEDFRPGVALLIPNLTQRAGTGMPDVEGTPAIGLPRNDVPGPWIPAPRFNDPDALLAAAKATRVGDSRRSVESRLGWRTSSGSIPERRHREDRPGAIETVSPALTFGHWKQDPHI
jgi:hypothetical protein